MPETHILVMAINITHSPKHDETFSKERQALIDQGWRMRGNVIAFSHVERVAGRMNIWVTLIQDFERERDGEEVNTHGV